MKLNNRGQTLIIVIILIPLLLGFIAYIIDTSLIFYENNKNYQTTKMIIKEYFDKDLKENEVTKLFKDNKIEIKELKLKEDELIIKNEYYINSVFGNLIGIDKYKIDLNIKGIKEKNKIKYIKEWRG